MEQLQNSVHIEYEIQFAYSHCKLGSRSSRMMFVEPAAPEDRGQELLPYNYKSDKPGTKPVIPRVDTATHGVATPTPLADR